MTDESTELAFSDQAPQQMIPDASVAADKLSSLREAFFTAAGELLHTMEVMYPGNAGDLANGMKVVKVNWEMAKDAWQRVSGVPRLQTADAPGKKSGILSKIQAVSLRDSTAERDHAGLSPLESIVLLSALPTSIGYHPMTAQSHPDLFMEFESICAHAGKSNDKYVKRYVEAKGDYLRPRVVIAEDKMPMAFAMCLPWSEEPVMVITSGLLERTTTGQAANVLRHELAHAYKLVRGNHFAKTMAEKAIPFHNAAHAEEFRADTFAPRSSRDLRELAQTLDMLGDVFAKGDERIRVAMGIIKDRGILDNVLDETQKAMSTTSGSRGFIGWVERKATEHTARTVRGQMEKMAQGSGVLTVEEDGSVTGDAKHDFKGTAESTHPAVRERIARLEEAACRMDGKPYERGGHYTFKNKPRGDSHIEASFTSTGDSGQMGF
jgi:Zn-dependent protease with chaperone function